MLHNVDNSVRCLSNYFLASCRKVSLISLAWKQNGVPIRRNFSRPFLPSELRDRNELRLCETRNSLARVPRAKEPSWRIPPRYPFCFRRMVCLSSRDVPSTLKVIFRRPENVKPSAVSKRSLDAGVRSFKVS